MKIAFIGLGIMGKPMSKNLLKTGYSLNVFDIVPEAVADVAAAGGQPSASAAEAVQDCDVIVTMLPNSPQVKEVLLGGGGVVAAAKKSALIIDMSSIAPEASRECAAAACAHGLRLIDAPVSGGEPKAIDGTLSIMCGGEQADFDEALPILQKMGASVVLCGPVGAGNVTKLCNQIIVGVNIAAMGEALTLAAKAGVNPETVYKAIRGGLAGSTVLDAKVPMVLNRNFKPGFKIDLHIKDLKNAVEAGRASGSPTPFSESVLAIMEELAATGCGPQDHSGVVQYFERIAGIEIK
jgi:2-hydroxy-3-oxopropionate reductase